PRPHDVAQAGLWLRAEGQHDRRDGGGGPQVGQPGHPRMAVEHGPRHQHVEGALLVDLVGDVDDVGTRDDLVPRAERRLDGPAQCGRAADDENSPGDHGAPVVWSVPMHCDTGGGFASFWVWTTEIDSFCERNSRFLALEGLTASST